MIALLGGLWGRVVAVVVAVVSAAAMVLGWRHSIRRGAQRELSEAIQRQALEKIEEAKDVEREVDRVPDAAVDDLLRERGWLRD